MSGEAPTVALRRLVNGYQVTQAIHVAATLGIADLLADGPRASAELAAPEPVGGWAAYVGRPSDFAAWSSLLHTVRTGENAFRAVHGSAVSKSAIFDRAMTDITRRANRHLLDVYDFSGFASVVDVGGGHGALVAALLAA